jgi:NAD(P)-dependent dehydrogenase (short-subunit alcohol dehydrogenase family)
MEVAVVAGVGPGTGAALGRAFAHEGYAVGLLSRREESSKPVAEEILAGGGKALVVPTDVTNRQSVLSAIAHIRKTLGPITALAHNASGYGRGALLELDPEQVRQSFEANVMGALHADLTFVMPWAPTILWCSSTPPFVLSHCVRQTLYG